MWWARRLLTALVPVPETNEATAWSNGAKAALDEPCPEPMASWTASSQLPPSSRARILVWTAA